MASPSIHEALGMGKQNKRAGDTLQREKLVKALEKGSLFLVTSSVASSEHFLIIELLITEVNGNWEKAGKD